MLPEIGYVELNNRIVPQGAATGKSFLFDFGAGDFVLQDGKLVEVTGSDALKMWIEKMLRTEKNRFEIYQDTDYGVSIEDVIIGQRYEQSFIESEIKREISEALIKHPLVRRISNFSIKREDTRAVVGFTVTLSGDQSFQQEVMLDGTG
ncbi:MAG: DUF2634 domain-containing protein [Firmicutes bacterium]|nr:DUF2634 domain-containing protein [Bacillota bacterium]